jgi:hypothetical protein
MKHFLPPCVRLSITTELPSTRASTFGLPLPLDTTTEAQALKSLMIPLKTYRRIFDVLFKYSPPTKTGRPMAEVIPAYNGAFCAIITKSCERKFCSGSRHGCLMNLKPPRAISDASLCGLIKVSRNNKAANAAMQEAHTNRDQLSTEVVA